MDSHSSKKPPSFDTKMQALDPELSSLIEKLIGDNESKRNAYIDQIETLENKLQNFRGMIARRDEKILKLEAKIKRKK